MLVLVIGLFAQCKKESNSGGEEGAAILKVSITDAPGDYKHIYLYVEELSIRNAGNWVNMTLSQADTFDILDYTNGNKLLLTADTIVTGTTDEIRLVLAETNTLVLKDGSVHDLKVPSGSSSGIKIKLDESKNIQSNQVYFAVLDFDADKSIVKKGNGSYALKPVIRGYWDEGKGEAEGYAVSTNYQVNVVAYNGMDTLGSTFADTTGYYKLTGLPPASYNFGYESTNGKDTILNNIAITQGNITAVDSVDLN